MRVKVKRTREAREAGVGDLVVGGLSPYMVVQPNEGGKLMWACLDNGMLYEPEAIDGDPFVVAEPGAVVSLEV